MPSRNFLQYLLLTAKGLAMGAADVVPGVSGGTIAFISGIYEELIETIHKLDLRFFKLWRKEGFITAWTSYNLGFLVALFGGVLISIASLAKLITWLLVAHPILIWAFFFGLILASILYVGKQIGRWNIAAFLAIAVAAAIAYFITLAEPVASPGSTWFLFIAGFIAIIAMILPGISGSFILLLLGAYTTVLGIITQFSDGLASFDWELSFSAFLKLLVFIAGAVVGLKVFSRALNWMFKHYKDLTLAVLTGFMIGALNKIWPWKEVLTYRTDHKGNQVPLMEESVMPAAYEGDPQLLLAIGMIIFGFLTIFLLERISVTKQK